MTSLRRMCGSLICQTRDTHSFFFRSPFLFSSLLFSPQIQLVPKATHTQKLDQSFGSARVQCTAAGRSPDDCRDPRVLESILGKYYPSKSVGKEEGGKRGEGRSA